MDGFARRVTGIRLTPEDNAREVAHALWDLLSGPGYVGLSQEKDGIEWFPPVVFSQFPESIREQEVK